MPTYEYRCLKCGRRFEKFHPMSAKAPACPRCNSAVEKLITAGAGIIVKGSRGSCSGNPTTCDMPCGGGEAGGCPMGSCGHAH